jgi:uncharacterized protein (TIGR03437 family)
MTHMGRQLALLLPLAAALLGQSSTNGIYGGYVGSDRWFRDMQRTPATSSSTVPPDYVEVAGLILFPEGNPFPRNRLPDLRILARDMGADPVDRAPYVYEPGNYFYTVLRRGLQYDVSWMYYFGDRERFATILVDPAGPAQRAYILEYHNSAATLAAPAQTRTTALAPGSSVQMALEAASGSRGALSAAQYSIDAPAGTSKLALAATTTLDANLYLRRGQPVTVQQGRAVYDYVFTPNATQARFEVSPAPAGVWYAAAANFSSTSGTVGLTASLAAGPALASGGVVSAATYQAGAVAPGQILALFGAGLGPAALTPLRLTPQGLVDTTLAETRVLFDGVPAPLLYASDRQTSVIVPYVVAGKTTGEVQVEYRGVRSSPVALAVAPAAPGLFTANSSGAGQAAALNQDYTVNGPSNPAPRESVVTLFGTGEGETSPGGIDGKLAAEPLPRPRLPVAVRIGGLAAEVLYAGAAPGLVAGVLQINARVPAGVAAGAGVPVTLTIGNATSPSGVTLAIQ